MIHCTRSMSNMDNLTFTCIQLQKLLVRPLGQSVEVFLEAAVVNIHSRSLHHQQTFSCYSWPTLARCLRTTKKHRSQSRALQHSTLYLFIQSEKLPLIPTLIILVSRKLSIHLSSWCPGLCHRPVLRVIPPIMCKMPTGRTALPGYSRMSRSMMIWYVMRSPRHCGPAIPNW